VFDWGGALFETAFVSWLSNALNGAF
jgi:hypothetical protein